DAAGDDPGVPYTSPDFGLLALAGRLVDMLRTENAVSDWVRATEVNALVQWRDDFVDLLTEIILETKVDAPDALIQRLDALVHDIAQAKKTPALTAEAYLQRIGLQADPRLGPRQKAIFERILFILDHIAELQEKRKL